MCTVSNIGDGWRDSFPKKYPDIVPYIQKPQVSITEFLVFKEQHKKEIEELRNEIKELKKLLKAAKEFDAKTGQSNCEMDDKVEFIRKIAELVGVDMNDVFFGKIKVKIKK